MGNVYVDSSDEQESNPRQADTFTVQLTSVVGVRQNLKDKSHQRIQIRPTSIVKGFLFCRGSRYINIFLAPLSLCANPLVAAQSYRPGCVCVCVGGL